VKDYYAILGLDPDASTASIKVAYRRLALENHPDRVLHLDKEAQTQAAARMSDLNEAYSVLSDNRQRREYDSKYVAPSVPQVDGATPTVADAIDEVLKSTPTPTPTRPKPRPGADVLSNVVRQFADQTRKELVNQKSFTWKDQRMEGFDWALNSSFWLASYWTALRGFPTADRAAAKKFTNYANLAINQHKSWLKANYFLLLLPFQRLVDAEAVVNECQRFTQNPGLPTLQGIRALVVLFDVSRGQSKIVGPRVQDKLFLHLLQTLRLSRT
jgi:curved DNA-binding protein CbpA